MSDLVAIARAAVNAWVHGRVHAPEPGTAPARPLFVTLLDRDGALRGCVGHLVTTTDSLDAEVAATAVMAASEDPRFPTVRADELDGLRIEVHLLGPCTVVEAGDLDPHRYGIVVSSGIRRAVQLPSVAGVDTAEQQLELARNNAGIGPLEPLRIERFEVETRIG